MLLEFLMSLDHVTLQSFIAVAQTGSFTKAAAKVGRTQSAVSQQVAKLEHLFGRTLLARGKSLSLTTDGEIFLSYAYKMAALYSEILNRFKEPELQGEVHFGVPDDFASVFLSEVLADFVHIHPSVLLNVSCDFTPNLFSRFKDKEFDLVLVKMSRPEDFPNGVNIWSEPLYWVGEPNLFNISSAPVPLVLSPFPCIYRQNAIIALEKSSVKWRLVFSSPSYAGIIAAVKTGIGITVLPRTMIPNTLNIVDSKDLPKLNNIHVSLLKHNPDCEAVNSFESFVLNKIRH